MIMRFVFFAIVILALSSPSFAQWNFFNRPPTIDPIDDYGPIPENSGVHQIKLTGIGPGADNEDQIVTITARTDNPNLIINLYVQYDQGNSALLNFSLEKDANGDAKITVRLDDGQNYRNITEESFNVDVLPVNGRPSFQLSSSLVKLDENAGKVEIKQFATNIDDGDPEIDQKFDFITTVESISGSLVFKGLPKIEDDGDLKFEVRNSTFGEAVVATVLKDNGGTKNGGIDTSEERLFTIRVGNINDPPTLDAIPSPLVILEDAGEQTVQLTGISAGDNEDQQLQITASSNNPGLVSGFNIVYLQGASTGQLKFTTKQNKFGNAIITVQVNDGQPENNIITKQFTLIVNPKADTPSITDAIYEGPPYTTSGLVISRNSADGAEVTHFKVTEIQNGKLYHNNGTDQILNNQFITYQAGSLGLKFAPNAGIPSNGIFRIQAATGANDSKLGGVKVLATVVVDNDPPEILTTPDTVVEITEYYSYNIEVTDPNQSDQLTITADIPQNIKAWLNFQITGDWKAVLSGTPPSGSAGIHAIKIRVEDQFGEFAEQPFNLYVNELNKWPVLSPFSLSIMEDDTIRFVKGDFKSRFSDPDGDTLTYWKLASAPQYGNVYLNGVELAISNEVSVDDIFNVTYVPVENYFGLDIFDWNASDGKDFAQIPQRLTIFIASVNDPPEILKFEQNPFTFEYAEESMTITDSAEVIDADGDRIEKMIVSISKNYNQYEDSLFYERIEDLNFNWEDSTGILTIRGNASPSVFQQALRSIKYVNLNRLSPSGGGREVEIVLHDADTNSIPYLRQIEFKDTFVDLVIPTGFTPNEDRVNDTWEIENLGRYEDYNVTVYSRYGQMVFETRSYLKEWDGSHKGNLVPVGAYYYIININKFEKVFKGTVTVLR